MATLSNISSKYKDIIAKSNLICPGCPAVYQLKPKNVKFGTLTRLTVGEKNSNKTSKTVLLVGETGSGKSTLINALVNYTMGVKFEDDICFEIVEREKRSQAESQTSDVVVYEIFGFEDETLPFSLTVIDTPGYGDTRGVEKDAIVSQKLFDLFSSKDGVHEIDAVGLVVKASENRLSDRLRYIFDSVVSLFGKDLEENIVALITHSDGIAPINVFKALEAANIKCAKNEKNQPVHFLFNNSQTTEKTEDNEFGLETAWRVTNRGMGRFGEFLKRSKPQTLSKTVDVLNERIKLAACIHNLQDRIKSIELKMTEINQIKEALQNHKEEMEKNKKFTVEVDEVYKTKQQIDSGMWGLFFYEAAVCCKVCEENCHYPGCTMAWYPSDCVVMANGHCTIGSCTCPVSYHVKENWIYVTKTRKVQITEEEMKKKYEMSKSQSGTKGNLLDSLQREMKSLTAEQNKLVDEGYQHVLKLEQNALNVNALSTHACLDVLIEKMEEKGDTEKFKKLKEVNDRADKGSTTVLRSMFGKLTAAFSKQ